MRTDTAIEKLCELTPILADTIGKLRSSSEYTAFMAEYKAKQGDNTAFILNILPLLFKLCGAEIYAILAIMTDTDVEAVKSQPFYTTFNQCKEIFTDKDFKDFFSLLVQTQTTQAE